MVSGGDIADTDRCHVGGGCFVSRVGRRTTMTDTALAERFEGHRAHLQGVARRMLGSPTDADDAVQEAWIRLSRSDPTGIDNLGGWLTTVVSRVCLDMLRQRSSRPVPAMLAGSDDVATDDPSIDPEHNAVLADSIGPALLVVLDTLTPSERVAFVLHDVFGTDFDQIAAVLGSSTTNARQLASRGRRRIRGAGAIGAVDIERRQAIVEAFLAAARNGDFDALLSMLAPDVVVRPDAVAVSRGAKPEVVGAAAVAAEFAGRATVAAPALIDGRPGAVFAPGDTLRAVFVFTFDGDLISSITLTMDPERLVRFDISR
jgi:RNA polymerase sigma factor (sigma-70 family)